MSKSRYEYVRHFEIHSTVLPQTWVVVRLDGRGFTKFTAQHNFEKPNDIRALSLMNQTAQNLCLSFKEVVMAYGQSDEYTFVFAKKTKLFNRRTEKILSTVVSKFTSEYVFNWSKFFDTPLQSAPSFDGRIVCYPNDQVLMDYMRWRQTDCHVNNLYNTVFWALVKDGLSQHEAHEVLKGTVSAEKNEMLFGRFGINYNDEPEIFKKGTVLVAPHFEPQHISIFKEEFYLDSVFN